MPSRNSERSGSKGHQYNLVQSDDLDTRVPLMPDEAFQHGIQFNCKFIGSMDIPRPTSRVEIVAAMRRVRFEFKQKGIKKKKVVVTISVNGIKTTLRKRRSKKRRIGRSKDAYVDVENSLLIEGHPIYRIFYVSHDSQDVKIFSYIARETSSNVFHCCVFKATKKAQAMRIVRTVGQAFEVCHKLVGHPDEDNNMEDYTKKEVDPTPPTSPIKRIGSVEEKTSHQSHAHRAADKAHKLFSKLARRTSDGHDKDNLKAIPESKIQNQPVAQNKIETHVQESDEKLTLNSKSANSNSEEEGLNSTNQSLEKDRLNSLNAPASNGLKQRPSDLNLHKDDIDLVNLSTPATPTLKNANPVVPPSPIRKQGNFFPQQQQQFQFGSNTEIWAQTNMQSGGHHSQPMAAIHEAHLLKEKLEQQQQQTHAALAQINLLRDQLAAESAARIEAQARTHQLLLHNKELLDHLQSLVRHIQELEGQMNQNASLSSLNNSPAPALPQLTPRSKIERWFQYAVLTSDAAAAKNPVTKDYSDPEELEDDPLWEGDDLGIPFHKEGQRGKIKVRDSKRTLVSKGESGFVSENTLNSNQQLPSRKSSKYFNFSSSSIFRRVLRLDRNRTPSSSEDKGKSAQRKVVVSKGGKKRRRYFGSGGRSLKSRRAELEAVVMRSGQGIGNKSFIGSTSTVHFHQNHPNFKRATAINTSQKSRVSSL